MPVCMALLPGSPALEPMGDTLKIKGGAMFKKGRFLGYMDE
jgi:hypothetical protein